MAVKEKYFGYSNPHSFLYLLLIFLQKSSFSLFLLLDRSEEGSLSKFTLCQSPFGNRKHTESYGSYTTWPIIIGLYLPGWQNFWCLFYHKLKWIREAKEEAFGKYLFIGLKLFAYLCFIMKKSRLKRMENSPQGMNIFNHKEFLIFLIYQNVMAFIFNLKLMPD